MASNSKANDDLSGLDAELDNVRLNDSDTEMKGTGKPTSQLSIGKDATAPEAEAPAPPPLQPPINQQQQEAETQQPPPLLLPGSQKQHKTNIFHPNGSKLHLGAGAKANKSDLGVALGLDPAPPINNQHPTQNGSQPDWTFWNSEIERQIKEDRKHYFWRHMMDHEWIWQNSAIWFPDDRGQPDFDAQTSAEVYGLADGWRGVRLLGKGGQGTATLWEYQGLDLQSPKRVVLKEVIDRPAGPPRNFNAEGDMMRSIAGCGPHVLRLYERGEPGFANEPYDWFSRQLFLEFMEGGDVLKFIQKRRKDGKVPLPELAIWRFLDCLVKGLNVLDHQSEDDRPQGQDWDMHQPICHFGQYQGQHLAFDEYILTEDRYQT
jgi:hypothetical protein